MDRSLYNRSGCFDKTAHDAICAASKQEKRNEDAETFVRAVKRKAKGFNFKLTDRIRFEDVENGKKYV